MLIKRFLTTKTKGDGALGNPLCEIHNAYNPVVKKRGRGTLNSLSLRCKKHIFEFLIKKLHDAYDMIIWKPDPSHSQTILRTGAYEHNCFNYCPLFAAPFRYSFKSLLLLLPGDSKQVPWWKQKPRSTPYWKLFFLWKSEGHRSRFLYDMAEKGKEIGRGQRATRKCGVAFW